MLDESLGNGSSCLLTVGVHCLDEKGCDGKVTLEYEDSRPKQALFGSPVHFLLQSDKWTYYYVTVEVPALTADLYGVLTPLRGDGELYANIQAANTDPSSWFLPKRLYSHYRSKELLGTKVVRVPDADLQ
mmetsp:Transcript_1120/g.690  ORF Transcript_1120/g.690 Transcript_1120/m.690 type:complete len:130 (+) Transcript_1120:689-1078(+)